MKLIGPMLQPDIQEKRTSLDRLEPAYELLQGVRRLGPLQRLVMACNL